jgi:hypothetical protein
VALQTATGMFVSGCISFWKGALAVWKGSMVTTRPCTGRSAGMCLKLGSLSVISAAVVSSCL